MTLTSPTPVSPTTARVQVRRAAADADGRQRGHDRQNARRPTRSKSRPTRPSPTWSTRRTAWRRSGGPQQIAHDRQTGGREVLLLARARGERQRRAEPNAARQLRRRTCRSCSDAVARRAIAGRHRERHAGPDDRQRRPSGPPSRSTTASKCRLVVVQQHRLHRTTVNEQGGQTSATIERQPATTATTSGACRRSISRAARRARSRTCSRSRCRFRPAPGNDLTTRRPTSRAGPRRRRSRASSSPTTRSSWTSTSVTARTAGRTRRSAAAQPRVHARHVRQHQRRSGTARRSCSSGISANCRPPPRRGTLPARGSMTGALGTDGRPPAAGRRNGGSVRVRRQLPEQHGGRQFVCEGTDERGARAVDERRRRRHLHILERPHGPQEALTRARHRGALTDGGRTTSFSHVTSPQSSIPAIADRYCRFWTCAGTAPLDAVMRTVAP